MSKKSKVNRTVSVADFNSMFCREVKLESIDELAKLCKVKRGRPWDLCPGELVMSLVYHVSSRVGTLGENVRLITSKSLAESTLSERRQSLPWEVFQEVMEQALKPRLLSDEHQEGFYCGRRLLGLDGTSFSLRNTPRILKDCAKAVSRRAKAAFAKVGTCVLVELGSHNPIAAEVATEQESEWNLAVRIIDRIPANSLLLADRLYGCQQFVSLLLNRCEEVDSDFLLRARSQLKGKTVKRLKDGSRLIEITVRDPEDKNIILEYITLREIRAKVECSDSEPTELRLWTSLCDPKEAPAQELAELYAKRWEHELYYREIKHELSEGELLDSNTLETACQEIAALILASALVAEARVECAGLGDSLHVTVVSFRKALMVVEQLWMLFATCDHILSKQQKQEIVQKLLEQIKPEKIPKKRHRSYPRNVRQPVTGWPRKMENTYTTTEVEITIF